ncbi:MAG: hypothetical protein R3348_06605 [Xanthomonadales bacterium]|nr:hypothetical protein [Xanthomonadales bacterium]
MNLKRLIRAASAFALSLSLSAHATLDSDLLAGLKARAIGPAAIGGRISAVDALASDPNRIIIGVATGGVWMSGNGGLTWTPVFDDEEVASIGAVAINQQNPDIIWVGTGEGNTRNSTSIGRGIYKSVDGGRNWQRMGLAGSERINRIALHPTDPDTVYVAALGTLWAPNEERGVYRTRDGGETWERVLYVDENTGATDIKMDPTNPNKLFAGMWQFRRWPFHFKSGGPGSGMYVTLDGGNTWEQRTEDDGLPAGELGRMAFSIAASDPSRVYALVEAEDSALLRSDDGGFSFQKVNTEYNVADRPFYNTEIFADPRNPDRVYNMATRLRVSIDGGKNFEFVEAIDCCAPGNTVHIDNHGFWINPHDPKHLIIGNDGGIAISRDRGETWRFVRNLPLAQFYHIAVDNEHPYNVYGGLQDNGSWRGPSEIWVTAGIRNLHWQEVGFGDGFDTIPDPENAMAGYVMSQGGYLYRYNLETGEQRMIRPAPPSPEVTLRFNWNAGFEQDPFDAATIYYGSQFLHRSRDRGLSWEVMSGDLTSNDPEKQTFTSSGGLTPDVTAAENYTSIVAVSASRLQRGVLWVGTDDGRVHVTRDGGESWSRIDDRARGVPAGTWVPMIYPSPHDAGTAFVVFDDHRRGNMAPYLFRVSEYGSRWESLVTDNLDGYALSVVQDSVDPDLLFLGTELGLWLSVDGGDAWTRFRAGVPTVSVMDLAIQERETDLVLGTHGRSVYIVDDYSALRDLDASDFDARLRILAATDGQQYDANPTASTRFTGSGEFRGPNEAYGVVVTFIASGDDLRHPNEDAERARKAARRDSAADEEESDADTKPGKLSVTVRDSDGEVVRRFTSTAQQGINRITWNMTSDGVRNPPSPDHPLEEDSGDLPDGVEVVPGRYTIELQLADVSSSIEAEVLADPRTQLSAEQHAARYAAQQSLLNLEEQWVEALERIDGTRKDIGTLFRLMGKPEKDDLYADLRKQAKQVRKGLNELEAQFRVPPRTTGIVYDDDKISQKIAMAQFYVGSSSRGPSPTAQVYVEQAQRAVREGLESLDSYMSKEVAGLRAAVATAGLGLFSSADPGDGS